MPRKNSRQRTNPANTGNNRGRSTGHYTGYGIRFYPRADQTAEFDEYFERVGCDLAGLFDAVGNGFKFSLTIASDASCFFATLTDKDPDSSTSGCWLTLQAADPDRAIARVLWALFEVGDGSLANLDALAEQMSDRWQ